MVILTLQIKIEQKNNKMNNSNKDLFTQFPDSSRVWLYQSDRELSSEEINKLEKDLQTFAEEWAAHGNKMWAAAKVLNPYFSVIVVNDALVPPSGCSVDASVKFIKELGQEMKVNFFDRMKVTLQEGEELKQIHFSELDEHQEALIFDPMISKLNELREEWPRPIEKSSFAKMVG